MKYLLLLLTLFGCGRQTPSVDNGILKPNQMINGCVHQESGGHIIKTCG
jgi:hypothetical protein